MINDDYWWLFYDYWWLFWLLMIIVDDWLLKTIVIANFSSSINKVIRPVFFFYDKISQVQKRTKKHQKALKSIKKHLSGKK